jgi:hypothetical protein
MTVAYRTIVLHVPPTPLGMCPERWVVEHWCNECHQRVATNDLVAHAQRHEGLPRRPETDTMTVIVTRPDPTKEVLRD